MPRKIEKYSIAKIENRLRRFGPLTTPQIREGLGLGKHYDLIAILKGSRLLKQLTEGRNGIPSTWQFVGENQS